MFSLCPRLISKFIFFFILLDFFEFSGKKGANRNPFRAVAVWAAHLRNLKCF